MKIGIAGIRGLSTLMGFNHIEGVEVSALCDLDEGILASQSLKYNIPKTFRVFEDMLMSDIDAVVISTPMQCHVPQAILALEAGKHVMSEVTAGVTIDELWWLIESVEKSGRIYMMAENYCYTPEIQLVRNLVRKGLFGEIYYGEGSYLHDIRELTTYHYGLHQSGRTSWRKYWQLGKRGAFYPTHSIGPVMQWFENDRIAAVSTFGSGRHVDLDLRQEDTTVTLCQMASGKLANIRIDCISPRPHNMSYYQLQGTRGCYEAPRGLGDTHKIWLEDLDGQKGEREWRPLLDLDEYLPERYRLASDEQSGAGHGGGDFFIVSDFIEAIRQNTAPEIDVYKACEWTAVALLSELSVTSGGRVMEMPNFRKNMPFDEQHIKI
jgi:predicted dehydrogenase